MEKVRLGELVDFFNGYAFKSSDYVDESNTLNCRMSNIRPDGSFDIRYSAKYLPDTFANKYSDYILKDGDLIIAMTDMAGDPKILGIPTVVKTKGYTVLLNQRVGKLTLKTNAILPEYLKYSLSSKPTREYFKSFAGGGIQLNIGKKEILNTMVCICDIEDQKHIVKILSKITNLIDKRKKQLSKLDELVKARFVELMQTYPSNNLLEEFISAYKAERCGDREIPVLSITKEDGIVFQSEKFKKRIASVDASTYKVVPRGKLVQGIHIDERNFAIQNIADEGIVSPAYKIWNVNEDKAIPEVLAYAMRTDRTMAYISSKFTGSVKRRESISMNDFMATPIDLPSVKVQTEFYNFMKQTDKSKLEFQKSLEKLELLKKALMQKYFG